MPTARSLASLALCLALFCAPLVFPPAAKAAATCPVVEPPVPLRILYRQSQRIVVARAGESRRIEGEDKEYQRKTSFTVTESLKGDPGEKTVHVYHWVSPGDADYAGNFRGGETVMLFLRQGENEEQDGYQLVDYRFGAKRLSEDDLKVYIKRIEELPWLMRQEPVDQNELVEWLVRCAEERATRWEGAYELSISLTLAEQAEEEAKREAAGDGEESEADEEEADEAEGESAEAEAVDSATEAEEAVEENSLDSTQDQVVVEETAVDELNELPDNFVMDGDMMRMSVYGTDVDSTLHTLLNEEQKGRLASTLFGAEELGEGELALVEVVKHWDDGRLAPFLVKHLRKFEQEPPYDAERLVVTLAHALDDEKLIKLAEKYVERAEYVDYTPDDPEEGESSGEEYDSGEVEEEADVEEEEEEVEVEERNADGQLVKRTSAERRSKMLRGFLAAVEDRLKEMNVEAAQR